MGVVYAGGDPGEEVSGVIIRAKRNRVNGRKLVGLRQWMGISLYFAGMPEGTGANADHRSLRSCCKIGEDEYEQEENRTIKNYIQ